MVNFEIRQFLSFGLIVLVFTTAVAWGGPALADNHCHKNHDKNCNHSEKNQNSSPKINCEIHIDAEDHLNNNDFGPNEQQCQNNSNNIKDSTVIQNPPSDGGTDAFKVVETSPSDGENNVPIDLSEIKVTFNKIIDKNSVDTGSLSVFADNCGGNIICNDPSIDSVSVNGKSVTFSLNSNDRLSPDTNYIARISSHTQDQDGNFLDCFGSKGVDDNCEWNFSTSDDNTPPTVVSFSPSSDATGVPITSTITATFSEPVQSSTVVASSFIVKDSLGTIPGTISASSDLRTYTFTPLSLLSGSATYSVTITTAVKDLSGNALASDKKWSFTTAGDTIPPTVESTFPLNNAQNVPVNISVNATFSEPMRNSTVSTSTFTLKESIGGAPVGAVVSLSQDRKTATLDPDANLTISTQYTATIKGGSNGVKDLSGNAMTSDKIWSFTTTTAPLVPLSATTPNLSEKMILPDIFG